MNQAENAPHGVRRRAHRLGDFMLLAMPSALCEFEANEYRGLTSPEDSTMLLMNPSTERNKL